MQGTHHPEAGWLWILIGFAMLALALAGCSGGSSGTPAPMPTASPSPSGTASATPAPVPTASPSPSGTASATATPQATSTVVSGSVVLGSLGGSGISVAPGPVAAPSVVVWLQAMPAASATPAAQFVAAALSDSAGNFSFPQVAPGTYVLSADIAEPPYGAGLPTAGSPPSIATVVGPLVVPGNNQGMVLPLVPDPGPANRFEGQFNTLNATNPPGPGDDVTYIAMQPVSLAGITVLVLVPQFYSNYGPDQFVTSLVPGGPLHLTTTTVAEDDAAGVVGNNCTDFGLSCVAGVNCACFDLGIPASNAIVGGPSTSGAGFNEPQPPGCAAGSSCYQLGYYAAQIGSGTASNVFGTPECSPSQALTALFALNPPGPLTNVPGTSFSGCN